MKIILKLEELTMFAGGVALLYIFHVSWQWYLLLLAPDVSLLGYLGGGKIGAWSYNLFHCKAVAVCVAGSSLILGLPENQALLNIGIILFAHASMDRILGYGLKYEKGFRFTHLGEIEIGKK